MIIRCIWEHNGEDSLLYAENFPAPLPAERGKKPASGRCQKRLPPTSGGPGEPVPAALMPEIVFEKASQLNIRDADSDVLFPSEREGLTTGEYARLKGLALKSAADFLTLFRSVPDPDKTALPPPGDFLRACPPDGAGDVRAYQKMSTATIFRRLICRRTTRETSSPAGNGGSPCWSSGRIFSRRRSFPAAMKKTGHCGRCCGGLSGTTGSTRKQWCG